jgi:hypothetical protein
MPSSSGSVVRISLKRWGAPTRRKFQNSWIFPIGLQMVRTLIITRECAHPKMTAPIVIATKNASPAIMMDTTNIAK